MRRLIIPSFLTATLALTAPATALPRDITELQRQLNRVVNDLRKEFETSADVLEARAMLRKTTADYQEACNTALAPLRETSDYKQLSLEIQQLEDQLSWGKVDDHMSDAQLAQTARALRAAADASCLAGLRSAAALIRFT